jgi:hypothetical protein
MALPVLTEEQRRAALAKAAVPRHREVKESLCKLILRQLGLAPESDE